MTRVSISLEEVVENEWYIVRYSGEIPEIAFNSAIYYLTRSPVGPAITLSLQQTIELKQAAVSRFKEIILRDLDHKNVNLPIYRGIERSIVNYDRFCRFCKRQDIDNDAIRGEVSLVVTEFLDFEIAALSERRRETIINCGVVELKMFLKNLGLRWQKRFETLIA